MQQSIKEDEQTPSHEDHIDEGSAEERGKIQSAYANVTSSAEIQYC